MAGLMVPGCYQIAPCLRLTVEELAGCTPCPWEDNVRIIPVFQPRPFSNPSPPPNNIFIISMATQAEKALGSSMGHFCGRHLQTRYTTEWHIGQLCVIIQHGLLLNDNIHCICLLVIERLPPGFQCQASALGCPEIYWSIDCLTIPTSALSLEPRKIRGVASLSYFAPAVNTYNWTKIANILRIDN